MKRWLPGFLLCLLAVSTSLGADPYKNEFRGIWISDPTDLEWETVIRDVKRCGLNAIFVNFASAGVAFYPSKHLPSKTPKDSLANLVRIARREGIAVHAKILTFFMHWAPEQQVQAMIEQGRVLKDTKGRVRLQVKSPWLDPSQVENRKLVSNLVFEILEEFEVDGFQFDYVRFFEEQGVPEALMQIRRTTLTNFVFDLSRDIRGRYPEVRLSACVFYDLHRAQGEMAQDWETWIRRRTFHFLVPMNYTTHPSELHKWMARQNQTAQGQTTFYCGLGAYMNGMTPDLLLKEITMVRQAGWAGFILFSYNPDFVRTMIPALSKAMR